MWLFFIFLFLLTGIAVIYFLGVWSNIRSAHTGIDQAWGQLKGVLEQRCSTAPDVINSCKMFLSAQEPALLEHFLSSSKKLNEALKFDNVSEIESSHALFQKSVDALHEASAKINKLKANKSFQASYKSLLELSDQVNSLVKSYNQKSLSYNEYITKFPATLFIAYLPGFGKRKLFTLEEESIGGQNKSVKANNRSPLQAN